MTIFIPLHAASEFLHFLGAESQVFQPDCFFRAASAQSIDSRVITYLFMSKKNHSTTPACLWEWKMMIYKLAAK
jgi:hypothetical protein